jgi:anti-sigma factor ChrR (cupin superfamily)
MESIKQHPTEEVLERYLFGLLANGESEPIEEHLLVCHACIDRAEQLLAFVQSLRSNLKQMPKVRAAGRSTLMENEA